MRKSKLVLIGALAVSVTVVTGCSMTQNIALNEKAENVMPTTVVADHSGFVVPYSIKRT